MSKKMLHTSKILIIDDNRELVESLRKLLQLHGEVLIAYDPDDGYEKINREKPDLVLLDIEFGSKQHNGLTLLRTLRERDKNYVPVIVMTGLEQQVMAAFESRADDFVYKDSQMSAQLRVRSLRLLFPKKTDPEPVRSEHDCWVSNELHFDITAHQVYFRDKPLNLTYRAMDLLKYLMLNHNIKLTSEKLLDEIFDRSENPDVRKGAVRARISEIRRAITDQGHGDALAYIETLHRFGYWYILPVEKKKCP